MNSLLYAVFLLLSLPNLIAGVACLIIRHAFATRNPLQIAVDVLFQVVWGLPLAGMLFILLLVFGIISRTRPYAAMFAFIVNVVGLVLFLARFGLPRDAGEGMVFLPVVVALIGFAWMAHRVFAPEPIQRSGS